MPKKTTSTTGQASKYLAPKGDIASLSRKSAEKKAAKFIGEDAAKDYPGLRMGKDLQSRRGVYSSWEDLYLVIFGPRRGKTTSQVIPAIVDAPGNVLTTSNKADIVYDTAAITAGATAGTTALLVLSPTVQDRLRFWAVGTVARADLGEALALAPVIAVGLLAAVAAARLLLRQLAATLLLRAGWLRSLAYLAVAGLLVVTVPGRMLVTALAARLLLPQLPGRAVEGRRDGRVGGGRVERRDRRRRGGGARQARARADADRARVGRVTDVCPASR